jgi:FSR family fosmidomycin resistance protein-like MFS transporter
MDTQTLPPETTVEETAEFQTGEVATVAGGHFIHDTYSAFLAPLLPMIRDRLETGYAATGSLVIFMQIPSLLNPFIGYLADKISLRYFVILAPGLTATLMTSLGFVSSYVALALLLFAAGISIAMFHAPAPAMIARVSGPRVGKGMSVFMAAGELGRTVGPVIVVAGVGWFGLDGLWRLAFVGWGTSVILYFRLRKVPARIKKKDGATLREMWPQVRRVFPLLTWLMVSRVMMSVALTTYLPIFISDEMEGSLWLAASALTILEGAGVAGALLAGSYSDRLGRARTLLILFIISPLLLLLFLWGGAQFALPLLIALGLTSLAPGPVLLATVQDEFPDNRALANGIYLALSFMIRAGGIWVVGWLADQYGLSQAYTLAALATFLAIPATYILHKREEATAVS